MQGKYVVLFFYPLDFTFVCPTEITAFSDKHELFAKLNAEVIGVADLMVRSVYKHWLAQMNPERMHLLLQILGISVDSQFSHLAWCQTGKGFWAQKPRMRVALTSQVTLL